MTEERVTWAFILANADEVSVSTGIQTTKAGVPLSSPWTSTQSFARQTKGITERCQVLGWKCFRGHVARSVYALVRTCCCSIICWPIYGRPPSTLGLLECRNGESCLEL